MKTWLKILVTIASACAAEAGYANYELTTLLGTPNHDMPFVRETVKNEVALVPGNNFTDFTTGVIYFAARNGTAELQSIQIFGESGGAKLADLQSAVEIASGNSAIVFAPITGSETEEMCAAMAKKKDTAFLVSFGSDGYNLSPLFTECAAKNILFVTVLNEGLTGLDDFATYGPLVRLAVPGMSLTAPVDGERSVSFRSDGFGMAVAAGQMSALLRKRPELKGAALISKFLAEAETLPSLAGKVTGAKAITRFER
jgi:hypothetical protein